MKNLFYKMLSLLNPIWIIFNNSGMRVLAYHDVPAPDLFETQLQHLKKKYNIITYNQLYDFFFKGISLPKKALLITFDDGDISFYENGFPLLKKYNVPAMLFVITELIDSEKPFWWNEIEYYLGKEKGNAKVWELKDVSEQERLFFLNEMRASKAKEVFTQRQLKLAALKEMQQNGIIISNHSHSHPMFNQCDTNELTNEMLLSVKFLKENQFDTSAFAYPNGNYSDLAEEVLNENEVKIAFLFDHKVNDEKINPLRISRLRVNTNSALDEFKSKVSGLHSFIYHLKK
ncbi:polysaccharide deacetylase family protein [Flavobacterium sp. AS60]|uniref:polysaccharide deacetylase family protein n=1 Tax=Flavobacterium anseongense TaxID=2910677 RepID=UPI001F15B832|nr:polysaccharide deacetylase family protein [Flavobacterium sp. AS60]MCF6129887.1 polysaccharide deacetylase family protein [Flavobacterium sp. AS60]